MKRRILSVIAVSLIAALVMSACSGNKNAGGTSTPAQTTQAASQTATAAPASETATAAPATDTPAADTAAPATSGERKSLTFGANNVVWPTKEAWFPDNFTLYMENYLNADITYVDFNGTDAQQLALASNSLPDVYMTDNWQQILDAKLAVCLDDYLGQYGSFINAYAARNNFLRKYVSYDGKLYFHTPNSGYEMPSGGTEIWNGYVVRWDLYKQIGAPTMANDTDFINALKQMHDIYPTTEDGLPVYGYGTFSDAGLWGYLVGELANMGYTNVGPWAYQVVRASNINYPQNSIHRVYEEDGSPFYASMNLYNQLNKLGLFDPDSFIMTQADYSDKGAKKQYLGGFHKYIGDPYGEAAKIDPNTLTGFMAVPGIGQCGWYGANQFVGWAGKYLFVNAKSKDPVLGVQFINMMDDPAVNRIFYSGQEGVNWKTADGVPTLTDDTIALQAAGGDAWNKSGINVMNIANYIGAAAYNIDPADGYPFSLWDSPAIKKASLNPIQKDFSNFYKVDYPAQEQTNMVASGKATSQAGALDSAIAMAMGAVPDDIKRIDTALDDVALKAIPKFVNAKDDTEFAAVKTQFIADLKAAGSDTSWAWWETNWNSAKDLVEQMVKNAK